MGFTNEHAYEDFLAVLGHLVGQHLADLDATVIDRRTGGVGAQFVGDQGELLARIVGGYDRRLLEADEFPFGFSTLARIDIDESAGDQGAQTRDALQADTRPDDPETSRFRQVWLSALFHLGRNDHAGEVLDRYSLDQPDFHLPELDLSLAFLDAFGSFESDGDRRPPLTQGLIDQPSADH